MSRQRFALGITLVALQCVALLVYLAVTRSREAPTTRLSTLAARAESLSFESLTLEEPRGFDLASVREPTLVHFWATWCPPCREELPVLLDHADASPWPLLLVTLDGPEVDWRASLGATSEAMGRANPSRVRAVLGVQELPVTLLIEPGGRVTRRAQGARDWSSRAFLESWVASDGAKAARP